MSEIDKPPIGAPCNRCGLCCRITVCGAGSWAMRLVETYGERAPGPCPALTKVGDGYECGLVLRPKDHIRARGSVTALRAAVALLIGAGAGCDEAGDEPDATALPKIRRIQRDYVERHGIAKLRAAADLALR